MVPPRRRRALVAALAVAALSAGGLAAVPTAGAVPTIPLGTSVWWACMQPDSPGPVPLRCPKAFDQRYPDALARAGDPYSVLVAENEMKMRWLQPDENRFDFAVADRLVGYAQAHGMHVRGHVLVFPSDLPLWMSRKDWTRASLLAALKFHIFTVMRHFKDKFPGVIREWDVVNEPLDDNGELSRNLLTRVIGADYVEQMLRFAREADPDALLFINEYNADQPNRRSGALVTMARDFVQRGVPLNGIGMQMHLGMAGPVPSSAERVSMMDRYADLGLRVAITELDIGLLPPYGAASADQQQAGFQQIAQDCADLPACTGMTVWGVGDALSWRGLVAAPLLLDGQYRPKAGLAPVLAILAAAPARAPVRPGGGESLLSPVPVIGAPAAVAAATVRQRGLRVTAMCAGTPPCAVDFTLTVGGARLATRSVPVTGPGHATRLRLSAAGARTLRRLRGARTARLRARIAPGPWVARPVRLTVGTKK